MKLFLVAVLAAFVCVQVQGITPWWNSFLCTNRVNCFVDPCQVSSCAAYPGAKCTSNYCGGCNAIWSLNGRTIDCSDLSIAEAPAPSATKCVTVNCFVNPCMVKRCDKNPTATCRANYCGGCNAEFFDARNQPVECD